VPFSTNYFIDPPHQKIDSRFSQLESGSDLLGSGSIPIFCSGIYVQHAPSQDIEALADAIGACAGLVTIPIVSPIAAEPSPCPLWSSLVPAGPTFGFGDLFCRIEVRVRCWERWEGRSLRAAPMSARPLRRFGGPGLGSGPAAAEAGFLLPIASLVSLVLLLGCLSIQSFTLQNARRQAALSRLRQAEDSLMSAAQMLVATLQSQHSCLLPLALEQWSGAGCLPAGELPGLTQGEVNAVPYQLLSWQPRASPALPSASETSAGAELLLELRPPDGQPALRTAFAVVLQGSPPRVRDLRLLGLRGIAP